MLRIGLLSARWTTRRWFASVLLTMVALILVGTVVGAQALNRTSSVSNRLADRISPARTAVVQFDVALRDQESGVRGYLLSGDPEFLDTYRQGVAAEQAAGAQLRTLLAGEQPILAELGEVEGLAAGWRDTVADPLVERGTGTAELDPAGTAELDRAAFDAVGARLDALDQRLVTARDDARTALSESRSVRDGIFLGLIALLLLLVAGTAVLVRVAVLGPLTRIGHGVRQVAGGDFEHRLTPQGPADVAQLGRDVEAMRHRLVDALNTSEQVQAELRRSNADLEQFAYVASHDLQEPLRKVASFCQMLQRRYAGELDDRAQKYIEFAVDGATRMQRLINDLLTFSRIGRVYDSAQEVDLNRVLDQVEQSLAMTIEESDARIVRPELPAVTGDTTLLTMLWQNLINNAIKFRRPGVAPLIEITADEADGVWTFAVQDNGIGIEPEFADKIFVIFQRLHPRESYSGTGIGLALCKKVVEHHGGAIELDTSRTDGARLVFTLPAVK
ncbi:ATP-binding protein [Actinoplanes sp. DH11]|uniref:sensor histidine kinase n=1 Tax=Actinoplanes sp. DH11 TaxID=2857011 RepID=UPI001E399D1B|nr:sensor histidine kinase [Actinoplanes sp. DH11]